MKKFLQQERANSGQQASDLWPLASGSRRAGFTLIEMLIVILVICILISVGFGGYRKARDAAWKEKSRDSARQIASAWNFRLQEDREFPADNAGAWDGTTFVADPTYNTDAKSLTFQSTVINMSVLNSNAANHIWLDQSADQRINGMKDRWGRYFHVRLDMDYDGAVVNPIDNATLVRANVLVWSEGPILGNLSMAQKSNSWCIVWQ